MNLHRAGAVSLSTMAQTSPTDGFSLLRVAPCGDAETLHTAPKIGHLLGWARRELRVSWVSRCFYVLRNNRTGEWFETDGLDRVIDALLDADYTAATGPNRGVWG